MKENKIMTAEELCKHLEEKRKKALMEDALGYVGMLERNGGKFVCKNIWDKPPKPEIVKILTDLGYKYEEWTEQQADYTTETRVVSTGFWIFKAYKEVCEHIPILRTLKKWSLSACCKEKES